MSFLQKLFSTKICHRFAPKISGRDYWEWKNWKRLTRLDWTGVYFSLRIFQFEPFAGYFPLGVPSWLVYVILTGRPHLETGSISTKYSHHFCRERPKDNENLYLEHFLRWSKTLSTLSIKFLLTERRQERWGLRYSSLKPNTEIHDRWPSITRKSIRWNRYCRYLMWSD